jgi:L-iditol 2-dehydrogenase
MKAAVVHGINDIRIQEVARPDPGPGEVVVRVRASGICATDVKMLLGQGLPKNLPTILGHEVAGEIFAVGTGVDGLLPGQRVAVYPIAVCGECFFCRRGRHNLCEKEFGLAHGVDGGFAEFVRIPRQIVNIQGVCELSPAISFEQAALAEPLSCCLAAARTGGVKAGDTVAVIGAGPMGLFHLKVARWAGARVIMADVLDERLDTARRMGSDHCINTRREDFVEQVRRYTGGRGADLVIAALGIPAVMEQCLPAVRKGGIFNIFGGPPAGQLLTIDPRWLHYGEITVTGTFASTPADFRRALELITAGEIEVRDMISHRFNLDNMLDAVEQVRKQRMIKGVVLID